MRRSIPISPAPARSSPMTRANSASLRSFPAPTRGATPTMHGAHSTCISRYSGPPSPRGSSPRSSTASPTPPRANGSSRATSQNSASPNGRWAIASTSCCAVARRRPQAFEMRLIPTASQTAGPFFRFGLDHPEWGDLTAGGQAQGEKIRIDGRVVDGDKAPLPDALVEIWQANAAGRYAHPEDKQAKALDPHFRGLGRCATDKEGRFRFITVKPGAVPGRGNELQAPHINLCIFARGLLKHVTTRLYFPDEALNKADPVLGLIEDAARRKTLMAHPAGQHGAAKLYRFDIVLQGEGETVFFDV